MPKDQRYPDFTAEELENETWVSVPGLEDAYEVSDLGRVRSLTRRCPTYPNRILRGRILKPTVMPNGGFYRANFVYNGEKRNRIIHTLVLETFTEPCPKNHEVEHIDGDKRNNRLSNIRYRPIKHNPRRSRSASIRLKEMWADMRAWRELKAKEEAEAQVPVPQEKTEGPRAHDR